MSDGTIISLGRDALWTTLLVAGPILGLGMLTGLIISIFQATTQINEQTLTFVPKIVVTMFAALVFGPWMLRVMVEFTSRIFALTGQIVR